MEDYYKVLGLKRGASLKEISAAYRSLALIYHPDKRKNSSISSVSEQEEADELFHRVKTAYQALQDPKIRAELDLQLIGQEERRLRDAQMSFQRRKLRDELIKSEKEAAENQSMRKVNKTTPVFDSKEPKEKVKTAQIHNREACLKLKIKQRNEDVMKTNQLLWDIIKVDLGVELRQIHPLTSLSCVAEFSGPQEAFNALNRIQNGDFDLISHADWLDNRPPSTLIISSKKLDDYKSPATTPTTTATTQVQMESKPKFTKELENSVLEKLRLKKLQQKKEK